MTGREVLYVAGGAGAMFLAVLTLFLVSVRPADRALQERLAQAQREHNDLQQKLEQTWQRNAEESGRREEQLRLALEKMRLVEQARLREQAAWRKAEADRQAEAAARLLLEREAQARATLERAREPEATQKPAVKPAAVAAPVAGLAREQRAPADEQRAMAQRLFEEAGALELAGRFGEALRLYTLAARNGHGKAAKRLGELYDRAVPAVEQNYAESLKWYNAARVLGEAVPIQRFR